jgi:hypothetical protein
VIFEISVPFAGVETPELTPESQFSPWSDLGRETKFRVQKIFLNPVAAEQLQVDEASASDQGRRSPG